MKPSVLYVFEGYGPGGDFGVCLDLCRLMTDRGSNCRLISRSDDVDDMLRARCAAFGLEIGLYKDLNRCLQVTGTVLDDYDVVHVHYPGNYLPLKLGWAYRRIFGRKPILLTLHGPFPIDHTCSNFRRRLSARLAGLCLDAVAVPSEHKLDELRAAKLFGNKVRCLPNPVRDLPRMDKLEARRSLGLPEDAAVCLWVGRIGPEKSPDVLLRALPRIHELGQKPILAIVGPDYGIKGEIKDLLVKHAPSVALLGYLPEPAAAYAACDTVVLTSRYESFSLVLFEAASAGRSIVAPDLPVVKKVFEKFESVSVYPWGDSDALAERLVTRLQNPTPKADEEMRASIMAEFGYDAAVEKHLACYRELISAHGRREGRTA